VAVAMLVATQVQAQGTDKLKVSPTVPELRTEISFLLGRLGWLGNKAKPTPPVKFGITCGGCVKEAKPNLVSVQPMDPCTPTPCSPASAEEIAELEAGIRLLQLAVEARKQGKPLSIDLMQEAKKGH
jgi:hypothetical protein